MTSTNAITVRQEEWGQIAYDAGSDEFHGHLLNHRVIGCTNQPISAGCLVTGKCDLKCDFCYGNDESLPSKEISVGEWAAIFRHLRSLGLMRVDLSGGEPSLRHDLPEIAREAIDAGLNVIISTNGRRLSLAGPVGFPPVRWHVSLDSGFTDVHESSRLLRCLTPSDGGFKRTSEFIRKCRRQGLSVRVLTCLGRHNCDGLFALGEHLALLGVREWNVSRILRAGRAQANYNQRFRVNDEYVVEQLHDLREAFPFIRIRYSNRVEQDGYFLLVLPDGSLATQYSDDRDKIVLGQALDVDLASLQSHPAFHLDGHSRKWISAVLDWQTEPAQDGRTNGTPMALV